MPKLADSSRFPAWAFSILHRTCADAIKKRVRDRRARVSANEEPEPRIEASGETITALDQAFAALTPDHRMAAVLYFGEGLSLAEIATATGVPVGTAKSRIFHARRQLKATLEGDLP